MTSLQLANCSSDLEESARKSEFECSHASLHYTLPLTLGC